MGKGISDPLADGLVAGPRAGISVPVARYTVPDAPTQSRGAAGAEKRAHYATPPRACSPPRGVTMYRLAPMRTVVPVGSGGHALDGDPVQYPRAHARASAGVRKSGPVCDSPRTLPGT